MSYSISLKGPGPLGPECPDPTYNLRHIFERALPGGLPGLSGKPAGETISRLEVALERLRDPSLRELFRELEPPNGWGTFKGACETVERLLELAQSYPMFVWDIR